MKEKLKKIDWLTLGIITLITTILCNAFLQMHFSSDTFVLYDLGYMDYPSQYFLLDGRLVSALVCYGAGVLNIPYEPYIIGMDVLAIIFVSISIYILYKQISKIIKTDTTFKKAIVLMSVFVLLLNQFSLEYLLFPESAVMCLGQLLCVIAATKVISDDKYKYLKIGLLLFFAVFCYQGLLNIFPVLVILLIFLKQMNNKNSLKINIIEVIKKVSIPALLCVVVIVINLISIKVGCSLLNNSSQRSIQLTDYDSVRIRCRTVKNYLDQIWNYSLNMLPKHINSIAVIATLILLAISKAKKETIGKYLFIVLIMFVICSVPMFFLNTGPCGRVNVPIAQLLGVSLLFLLINIEDKKDTKKWLKNTIYALVISVFCICSVMILRNTSAHIAANKVDQNMGMQLKYMIDEYEKKTGITVTKFSYIYDPAPQQYAPGILKIGSLTERKLSCSWCISQAVNYYSQRKLEKVKMPIKVYIEKFTRKDYTSFSEEQVVFDNDTLYLYVF